MKNRAAPTNLLQNAERATARQPCSCRLLQPSSSTGREANGCRLAHLLSKSQLSALGYPPMLQHQHQCSSLHPERREWVLGFATLPHQSIVKAEILTDALCLAEAGWRHPRLRCAVCSSFCCGPLMQHGGLEARQEGQASAALGGGEH